jgi:predicted nucleic acid-binding protein
MTANQFLDTNILVYAFDSSDPAKQQWAEQLIAEAARSGTGWLSTQVLGEFSCHRHSTTAVDCGGSGACD